MSSMSSPTEGWRQIKLLSPLNFVHCESSDKWVWFTLMRKRSHFIQPLSAPQNRRSQPWLWDCPFPQLTALRMRKPGTFVAESCDTDFEATQNTKLGELVHSSKHKGRLKLNRKASDPGLSLLSLFLKYINDMWHKICETTMLIKRASTQSCLLYWLSALPYYFNPHNNNMNPGGDREPAWPWAQYRNSVMSILGNILFACNTVLNYLYSVQEALGRV